MARTILLVDDDEDLRETLVEQLLFYDEFSILQEPNAAKALATAKTAQIDLLIMDVGLPDMDGHVVARAVRALSKAPVLFLTARSESDDVLAGMASGAAAYLTKPFRPAELTDLALQLCPPLLSQAPHISGKSVC